MVYKKFSLSPALAIGAFGLFAAASVFAQDVEIGTWAGFRKCAVSFTFDDNAPSQVSDAAPEFDKYGYRATFNLVTNWSTNGFQGLADKGHEIASHSDSHPGGTMPANEIASSKQKLNQSIKQKYGVITLAYPNCNTPGDQQVLQNYVVGRICNASWGGGSDVMGKDGPNNWAAVPAIMTGTEGTSDFKGNMQKALQSGGWVAFLTHGLQGKSNGNASYSPTNLNDISGALQWANQNDKDVWVAPMGFVAMYIQERKASKAEASSNGGTITVKLTHSIKKDNISDFDYPLSLRVKSDMAKPTVKQGDASLEAKVDGGYIYFDAVPNGGDIVISGDGGSTQPTESSSSAGPSSAASSSSDQGQKVSSSSHHSSPWGNRSSSSNGTNPAVSSSSQGTSSPVAGSSSSANGPDAIVASTFDANPASAYVDASGYITVVNAQGQNITVFNSLGHVVRTTKGIGCLQKVYSGAKGVYIVRIGNKAKTVSIK